MTSEPFLVTGLPRSRTAWMAVAAITDHSICYHEPMRNLARWDDVFKAVWHGRDGNRYVGISCHGMGFHLPEIMRRIAPRVLIIERPVADVEASLNRLGPPRTNFCELLLEALAYDNPRIMRVPYAALDCADTVMRCLRHLMPEARLSMARIRELQTLNIQADVPCSVEIAKRRSGDAAALLGADVMARLRAV